jgi:hypothetical protein
VLPAQPIIRQRVAEDNVCDVLALDKHVGLADRVGLGIQLLAIHHEGGFGVHAGEVLASNREHAACPCGRVVDRSHDARLGQGSVIFDEDEVDHEPNNLTGRKVLSGGLVRYFGEFANQLLEHEAHLGIADNVGMEVDVGELLGHQVEELGLGQALDLGMEVEAHEDVAYGWRETLDVLAQVFADVVLIAHQVLHVEGRRVVEVLS